MMLRPRFRPPRSIFPALFPELSGGLLRRLGGAEGSLRRRLVSGSAWHLGMTAYGSALLLAQTLLATHFLTDPRQFGLVNAMMWAYALAEVFTASGLTLALTLDRGDPGPLEGPVWTVQAVRGLLLGLGIGSIGTLMSIHYREPLLVPLSWTAALSAPLNGLAGLGPVLELRELGFRRVALFGALETTLGAAAGCLLIAGLQSAWAVAIGLNAMALARVISSYLMRPRRPRLDFRWSRLRPFAGFAASAFLTSVLAFGNERGDDLVVGTLLGLDALGIYHLAFLYANLPGLKIGQVMGNLLIPTLSRLREDPPRFRAALGKLLRPMAALSLAVFIPLWLSAPLLFGAVGGGRFLGAVPAFRVLCLFGALRFFQFTAEAALNALGRPRFVTRSQLVQLLFMSGLIVPLTAAGGAAGAGAAVAAALLASSVYSAWALARLLSPRRVAAAPPAEEAGAASSPLEEVAACAS